MKQIQMKQWEVRAILADRKSVTRRVVNPQPEKSAYSPYECCGGRICFRVGERGCTDQYKPPYRPGDILYVRETLFLRVTNVQVERLQDSFSEHGSTIFHLQKEGINIGGQCRACITDYGRPCCSDDESECGVLDEVRSEFSDLWDSIIKPADRSLYGWAANPWVWVIEFERISKEDIPPSELAR